MQTPSKQSMLQGFVGLARTNPLWSWALKNHHSPQNTSWTIALSTSSATQTEQRWLSCRVAEIQETQSKLFCHLKRHQNLHSLSKALTPKFCHWACLAEPPPWLSQIWVPWCVHKAVWDLCKGWPWDKSYAGLQTIGNTQMKDMLRWTKLPREFWQPPACKPNWIKPWAIWSDLRINPAVSKRLDERPPEVPSHLCYPQYWNRSWNSVFKCRCQKLVI